MAHKTAQDNLDMLVEVILTTKSRTQLINSYQTLSITERADLMAYMNVMKQDDLFRSIRNKAENLAR